MLDRRTVLETALDALPPMAARDRAAAHRLAAAVLRRLGTLDAALEPLLRRAPPAGARHVLRIGAAQALLLGTPPHAAVATAVALARRRGLAPFAGLVNAVLRRLAAAGPAALEGLDGPRLDTPAWLWASWGANARAIAEAHQHEAPLDLTLAPGAAAPPGGEALPTGSVRFPAGTAPDGAARLRRGRVLGAGRGGGAARPGCSRRGRGSGSPISAPPPAARPRSSPPPARRSGRSSAIPPAAGGSRENLARLRLPAEIVAADAGDAGGRPRRSTRCCSTRRAAPPAPSAATPTCRTSSGRRIWRRSRPQQDRLLAAARAMLRPGGRLIYAVCSLQPEEGAARVAAAAALGLRADPFSAEEFSALPEARTPEGFLRTHPGLWSERGGMDGFFAARMIAG